MVGRTRTTDIQIALFQENNQICRATITIIKNIMSLEQTQRPIGIEWYRGRLSIGAKDGERADGFHWSRIWKGSHGADSVHVASSVPQIEKHRWGHGMQSTCFFLWAMKARSRRGDKQIPSCDRRSVCSGCHINWIRSLAALQHESDNNI